MSRHTVEGIDLDLDGLLVLPGLVNAHDHLEFALFPRLGRGPYEDADAWARDIFRPKDSPIREHLRVPKRVRILWGGLRNLLAGVTLVSHHNPWESCFEQNFPVRVLRDYGWAHSFSITRDLRAAYGATGAGEPFLLHLAEGTGDASRQEVFRLRDMGLLNERSVLIHAVGLDPEGWDLVRSRHASVVWCPRSNQFLFGQTIPPDRLRSYVPIALGTDSPLTAAGDLLDELDAAAEFVDRSRLPAMTHCTARKILRAPRHTHDWIAVPEFGTPPELVVVENRIHLISPALARRLPASLRQQFYSLHLETRPSVLVRWDVASLVDESRRALGTRTIRLAGREVDA